jgi:putative tricarboxylic transport membrane protein
MEPAPDQPSTDGVATRWPELIVALVLMALGVIVVGDSLRVGAGWGEDGPRSGYFPFYIGSALLASSAWIALTALRRWKTVELFAEREQLKSVLSILVPMVVYVALIKPLGIYLASMLLIAFFMWKHGAHRWPVTAVVAVGVPLLFFVVFERWFLVPLPKGPVESLLGF